ncbi:MAG: PEP-CTERM sorting domain-containing protein [Armatimonadetes bacterium]|nr:PEP-CTERM sorting domain-containing protein [Armatimonadota bacterium]
MRPSRITWLLALMAVSAVTAGPISFTKVVDSSSGFLDRFGAPTYNDSGLVGFWGSYTPTSNTGLFTASAPAFGSIGPVNTIADTSFGYSAFSSYVELNNPGEMAFWGLRNNGSSGVFHYNGSSIATVFDTSGVMSGKGPTYSLGVSPAINDAGEVAFITHFVSGDNSAYLWDGSTSQELASHGFGNFITLNNAGVAVAPQQPDHRTLAIMDHGSYERWVNPSSSAPFYRFGLGTMNDLGSLAFVGYEYDDIARIYTATASGYSLVVDPHGLSNPISYNNNGNILYVEDLISGQQLNVYSGGASTALLQSGDVLDGKTVWQIQTSTTSLNNNDELAIWVKFTDSSSGIYVAGLNPVPEPATVLVLLAGSGAIYRRRRRLR